MTSPRWWVAPVIVATIAGGAFAAVALPGLASGTTVPDRLVVHRDPPARAATSAPSPQTTPHARPPTSRAVAPPAPMPTAHVVVPDRPVVRETDDRSETRRARDG